MKSIQMILAVFVIAALCGIVTSSDSDDSDYGYKRRSGYCTNKGCRSGYIYYGRNGDCKYGNKSWRYNCNSYVTLTANITAPTNTDAVEIIIIITTKATFIILRMTTIIASLTKDAVFVMFTIEAKPI
ncbi:Hypothetical predicted protein [Mytilus galloprovincialis]|uniref:Uncharacterized protein n=1 Tax=Mytilus galloprovincialis TaxID=29158 RepID=A0A8B6DYQ6_MYTGA|nr:Hypothetical predicted protein [Mytilus galloprovincialis]